MDNELKKELAEIKDRIEAIERRLDKPTKFGPRYDPNTPDHWPWPMLPLPDEPAKTGIEFCPRCGIEMKGVMGYVCNRIDCPTGLGPVMC